MENLNFANSYNSPFSTSNFQILNNPLSLDSLQINDKKSSFNQEISPYPILDSPLQVSFNDASYAGIIPSHSLTNNVLPLAQIALKEFSSSPDFHEKMNLAFGYSWDLGLGKDLINNLATGVGIPDIKINPRDELNALGAFGANTIYLSQDLLNPNQHNSNVAVNVFLEEMGHYIDSKLNIQDSPGDEGAIFAKLVQNQLFQPGELATLKAEDDSGTLNINGQSIRVEHADLESGVFLTESTGKITIDFLADAGSYRSEMAVFSLQGMEGLTSGSADFIKEAARRALTSSPLGYTVIVDPNEGAKFSGDLGESNKNEGNYSGSKTFSFNAGDKVAMMLVPQGTVKEIFDNPSVGDSKRPLFSIAAANANNVAQIGQLAPGTFGWEDIRADQGTDADYNDIVFQIKGATGTATPLGQLIAPGKDWRNTPLAQEIIAFASQPDTDKIPPSLTAALSQDTGINNSDGITNNPQIVGSLTDKSGIGKFQATFSNGTNFVDILSELKPDGSFSLDKNKLSQIQGGQLSDANYQLNLIAEDKFANVFQLPFKFTLDTTKPATPTDIGIKNDTDTVTNQKTPTIIGKGDGAQIELFDGQTKLGQAAVVNGVWEITPTIELTNGVKNLSVVATDIAGNKSDTATKEFTIDTVAPQLNISSPQANALLAAGTRLKGIVNDTGSKIDRLSYKFNTGNEIIITVNDKGEFDVDLDFTGLLSGQQNLVLKAIDLAGNITETTIPVTLNLDSKSPQINARLTKDTGVSATDGITSDATLAGTVTHNLKVTQLRAGLDSKPVVQLIELKTDNTFTLSRTQLEQINGGALPDGLYTLRLEATDENGKVGNFEVAFTLDTTAPQIPGFMLDSLFDSAPIGDSKTTFNNVNILGQTEANTTVVLQETGASITANASGKFIFSNISLFMGDNSFTVNAKDKAGNVRSQTNIIKRVAQDNSDVVLDWNATLLNAIYTDKTAPPLASRNMAMVQTAVFDAVNSFSKTYKNYHFSGTAPTGASAEAAAASAAYRVLVNLYPGQTAFFDTALAASLVKIPDGAAEDAGIAFGKTVADDILSLRSGDGTNTTVNYTPGTNPGDWQLTAPAFASALLPQWGQVKPFALTSGSQFRPAGLPALNSDQYTADFNQVKDLGSSNSTKRTTEQTEIAQFWADGSGTFTPPGHWNQIAQNVAAAKGNSLVDNARLFALLDISLADAGIAAWDAKYNYNFWRPITAIQKADTDGNPNTTADPNWTPLLTTPPFPEYISGHSTFSGAAATVLTGLLGNNVSFTTDSLGTPGVYRQFSNFTEAATEAGISRIYGGIHFNTANVDGQATGKSVGNYVLQNLLAPIIDNQPPVIQVSLSNDTGSSQSDFITSDSTIKGTITDTSQVTKFQAQLNSGNFVDVLSKLNADGSFNLDKATLAQINGGQLPDGSYQLSLKAEDKFGNASAELKLEFTLDSSNPAAPNQLSIKDDSDTVTNKKTPTITGKAETGTMVQLFEGETKLGETTTVNGQWEITTSQLTDGVKDLTVNAIDAAGNSSDKTKVQITVDTLAPQLNLTTPQANTQITTGAKLQGSVDGTGSTITELSYRFNNGSAINVPVNAQSQFNVDLDSTGLSGQQNLIITSVDLAGNSTETTIPVTVNSADAPLEISPTNGEEMVGLNRETIVRFGKKVDPNTVNSESFYLIANGQRVQGEIKVSSTEEFATFFYKNPLPSSTEVRVVVDGSKIIGRDGMVIDGDGDGKAGGIATADFTTLPITRIQGTDVWGYVYDSYNKNPDGSNIPIKGVTIRLDALPDVFAVTDDNGYFILKDVPAPDFFVYIDGSTATGAPAASQYASLGKPFHSVPGQSTQLFMDGQPFNVYLPPMAASDVKQLSTTEDTKVGFGDTAQAFLQKQFPTVEPELWKEVKVTFNPGSAQDDTGNKATQATIIPVDPNRLPAPLPPGIDPKLVISIQAGGENGFNREAQGGATNFDVPAPIQFPNLDGLKPGEKSLFWSFDHDAGKWVVIGTGTVSEDGKTIVSDPGVGVLAPGWHFTQPGTPTNGPKKPDKPDDCDPDVFTIENAIDLFEQATKCTAGFFKIQGLIAKVFEIASETKSLISSAEKLLKGLEDGSLNASDTQALFQTINSTKKILKSAFDEIKDQNPLGKALAISKCLENLLGFAAGVCGKITEQDSGCNTIAVKTVCNGLDLAKSTLGKVNSLIEKAEDGLKETLFALACGTIDQIASILGFAAQSKVETVETNILKFQADTFNIQAESDNLAPETVEEMKTLLSKLIGEMEGFLVNAEAGSEMGKILEEVGEQVENLEPSVNQMSGELLDYPANAYYLIEYGNFKLRGRTDSQGQFETVLAPNTEFNLSIYDTTTGRIARYSGKTAPSGSPSQIPVISYVTTKGIAYIYEKEGLELPQDLISQLSEADLYGISDNDNDGLVDEAEKIIGTTAIKKDTDNDGISDLAEIQQGLDPLGGQGFPTGIISSLPLQGEAKAVTVAGSTTNAQTQTAYVATGSYGLAVVNASQFNNPTVLGQLNLPGDATDVAVDTKLNIAAVASNSGGLHLVNVVDGMLPTLNKTLNLDANHVEISDGIAYATVDNVLHAIDLVTGEELQSLTLPGSGTVTGLAHEGTKLYAYVSGSDTFSGVDITLEGAATVLGQLNVNVASSDVGLSVGNGVAYLAGSGLRTINVSNPSSPTLISDADNFFTARGVTLNGSGLALVSAEGQGLAVYNSTDPTKTDAFLTVIDTPGFVYNTAIASGIAFVADGSSGLQVINYLPFDNKGQAPTITINTSAIDLDPSTDGIQVQEGSTIPIRADISDDVQVRNVELLVDDQVVSNDVSFPWDLSVIAPAITPDKNTVDIQVRTTDTGGNITLSNLLTLNLSPDKFAPTVLGTTPTEGARFKTIPSISIKFNEAIDTTQLNVSGITLTNLGTDGVLGGDDDVVTTVGALQTRNFDRTLVISPGSELSLGNYQLKIDPSIITDRVSNALANPITLNFTKRPLTTPLTFGTTITGSIVQAGDDEVYTFTGTAGQRIVFDALDNNTSNIYAQITSPSGISLNNYYYYYYNDNQPFTLTETGTYRVTVKSYNNTTGDYNFRLIDASTAPTITLGTTVTDTLTPGLENDIYQINGTAGQRLFFDSGANVSGAYWTLYGSGNQYITNNSVNSDFETTLTNDGTYLLVLNGYNSNGNVDYSFKVTNPPTTTTALTLGNTITSTISQPGEIDEYTFTGTAGQRLYYDGLINNNSYTIYTQLISPSGQTVFYNSDADGDRQPFTLTETGTYRLILDGYADNTGDYSFRLLDANAAPTITLDTTVTGTLNPGLKADVYQINGTAGQRLYFDSDANNSNVYWRLYGSNNQYIDGTSFSSNFDTTLNSDGSYLLVLAGNNSDGNINYSFKVTNPPTTTIALTLGNTITSTISQAGEIDEYTFTGTAGQRLYYDGLISNNTSTIYTQLISPSGQTVFYNGDADSDRQPFTLSETGTYKLILNGYQNNTGNYSFQLIDASAATNLVLNSTLTGTLDPGLKTEIYRINGTAGQKLSFDSLVTGSVNGNWTLYDSNNQYIDSVNLNSDFTATLLNDGTYFLVLRGDAENGAVNYNFKVTDISDAPVTKSGFNTVKTGTIAAGGQDTYTLTAPAGLLVYFDTQSFNANNVIVDVRDANNQYVTSFYAYSDTQPIRLDQSGTYTLTVKGTSASSTGDYSFQVIDIQAAATDLSLNTPVTKTLTNSTETVVYRFNGIAGQKLYYDALQSDTDTVDAQLISPSDTNIFNINSDSDRTLFTLTEAGIYYLFLKGNNASAADYSFQLLDTSVAPTLELDKTVTDKLEPGLETNIYQIQGKAGQRLYFDSDTNNSNVYWTLYSPNNQSVAGTSVSSDFETTLNSDGIYILVLAGYNSDENINYSFKVTNPPTTTTALTLGNTITSTISQPGEIDEYTFTGTAGQRLYYDALINNNSSTIYAQLVSPSGQTVFYNGDVDSDRQPFTLTETGTYRLILDGYTGNTGDYNFHLFDASAAPTITLDSTVTGTLNPGLKADVYQINGTAGQRLYFDTGANNSNVYWTLYSPNNQSVAGTSFSSNFDTTLSSNGTYLLVLAGYNSDGNTNYSFKVTNPPTTTTALTLGNTITSTISQPGEIDEYTFTGTAGQRLYYDALINNNSSTIYAQLISPSGQTVFYNGDADSDRTAFTLTETGTYKLIIDGYFNNTGDYSFRLLDASAAPTITLDTTVTNTLNPGLKADIYQINGKAQQKLRFNSSIIGFVNSSWALYAPGDKYINSAGLSSDFEATLPGDGIYILVINGYTDNGIVDYQFQVTEV